MTFTFKGKEYGLKKGILYSIPAIAALANRDIVSCILYAFSYNLYVYENPKKEHLFKNDKEQMTGKLDELLQTVASPQLNAQIKKIKNNLENGSIKYEAFFNEIKIIRKLLSLTNPKTNAIKNSIKILDDIIIITYAREMMMTLLQSLPLLSYIFSESYIVQYQEFIAPSFLYSALKLNKKTESEIYYCDIAFYAISGFAISAIRNESIKAITALELNPYAHFLLSPIVQITIPVILDGAIVKCYTSAKNWYYQTNETTPDFLDTLKRAAVSYLVMIPFKGCQYIGLSAYQNAASYVSTIIGFDSTKQSI